MKKIVGLTGASGNLGKKFVKLFCKKIKIIKFKGDITKKNVIKKWLTSNYFDGIIHFAAIVPTAKVENNYNKALKVNFRATKNLIELILKYRSDLKWFFYSSTSHVYASCKNKIKETYPIKPLSKYGYTKLLGEKIISKKLKKTNIKYTIGRIFSIIDNQDNSFLLNSLRKKIKVKEKKVSLANMNHYRDFLDTSQINKIIYKLFILNYCGIINIGSGKKTYLKNLAKELALKYKKNITFKDSKKSTIIIANINKLKKIIKL